MKPVPLEAIFESISKHSCVPKEDKLILSRTNIPDLLPNVKGLFVGLYKETESRYNVGVARVTPVFSVRCRRERQRKCSEDHTL